MCQSKLPVWRDYTKYLYKEYLAKTEESLTHGDQVDFFAHIKAMNLVGRRMVNSQYVKDGDGNLLRDLDAIRARWVCFPGMLLNAR